MNETTLPDSVRLYVPNEPAGMLVKVTDWLLANGVSGFTQYPAQGSWHDGQAWVNEPVTVIECWVKSASDLDLDHFLEILADWGQYAGFYVANGQGHLVDLTIDGEPGGLSTLPPMVE